MSKSPEITASDVKSSSGHPVSDKVKDTLHDSVDTLAKKAAQTESSIRETAQASSEALSRKQEEVQAKWESSSIKKYASENPVATAGIAFAAGMLLTTLLKRK